MANHRSPLLNFPYNYPKLSKNGILLIFTKFFKFESKKNYVRVLQALKYARTTCFWYNRCQIHGEKTDQNFGPTPPPLTAHCALVL